MSDNLDELINNLISGVVYLDRDSQTVALNKIRVLFESKDALLDGYREATTLIYQALGIPESELQPTERAVELIQQQATALAAAEAREREAEARERMIPVGERLPESGQDVVILKKEPTWANGCRFDLWTDFWPSLGFPDTVTHWMPLPEPPEAQP